MTKILYWPRFEKQYKKLPRRIQDLADEKVNIFSGNPFNPVLRTHKLSGSLNGYWAFSVNYFYRIIFRFEDANTALLFAIGKHDIYN